MQNSYVSFKTGNGIIQARRLRLWLSFMCCAIICMIIIGGFTRLTNAGLSITQWQPISGILPPLNNQEWLQEFGKYQESPEYIKINRGMSLDEFKTIFWTEFIHRLAGRVAGLLYLLPLLYFLLNKQIRGKNIVIYCSGLVLFGAQGIAGWYMVKSGLVLDPHVSHFRLAIHLFLAVILYAMLFWQLMKVSGWGKKIYGVMITVKALKSCTYLLSLALILMFLQIILGAFVAGLNAGLVYNSFPLMGEYLIPPEITGNKLSFVSFSEPVFVQFLHRIFAYLITITLLSSALYGFKVKNHHLSKALIYSLIILVIQVVAGILTLIYGVSLTIALFHQFWAIVLLSSLLYTKYLVKNL